VVRTEFRGQEFRGQEFRGRVSWSDGTGTSEFRGQEFRGQTGLVLYGKSNLGSSERRELVETPEPRMTDAGQIWLTELGDGGTRGRAGSSPSGSTAEKMKECV